jgi:large subunit ribosomal protein L24
MLRIKKNDTVQVITGKDKGKRGTVVEVDSCKNLIKVSGVALVTKHYKARRQGEQSGLKKMEMFINISNVMLVSPSDSKPTRVGFTVGDNGTKVRISKRTKKVL